MNTKRKRVEREGTFAGSNAERAIIDIGSNTVRLVVYGGSMRAPVVLLNEKVTARLGRDIASSGQLAEDAINLAMRGLSRFALLLDDLGIEDVETVATAAVREASNGAQFIARISDLGLAPRILSGEEEACISAHGIAGAFPQAQGCVADLGGGSLELVALDRDVTGKPVSLALGALRLPEYRSAGAGDGDGDGDGDGRDDTAMRGALEQVIADSGWNLASNSDHQAHPLYLVGGTWRAMAVFAMQLRGHPLTDPHGFELDANEAADLARQIRQESAQSLQSRPRISSMRAQMLPDAAVLLEALLARLAPEKIVFSSWGLREGLLYDRLERHEKTQDPLLAGVSAFAKSRGASATLATRIAGWTVDAAPSNTQGNERLRLAATMLSLASMQIEPNIRLPQAINWALHKRWIAIDAAERGQLAAAISANGNALDLPDKVKSLTSGHAMEEAVCWGLAVRLARRLGARSRRSLEVSRLHLGDGELVLRIAQSHAALFGQGNEKDIAALARRMGCNWRVEIVAEDELHTPN